MDAVVRTRSRLRVAVGTLLLVAALVGMSSAPGTPVGAQEPVTDPLTNPIEPAGRAVCNVASTTAAVLSYANFAVPADSPLTPNDVVVALTPIIRLCVDTFPPAPARQCFTGALIPTLGLPLTPPDPLGIITEQLEAVLGVLDPLGLALRGPLHDFFVDALECKDRQPPGGEEDYEIPVPSTQAPTPTTTTTTTTTVVAAAPTPPSAPPTQPEIAAPVNPVAAPAPVESAAPAEGFVALTSSIPEPLRGPAVALSVLVVVGLGGLLRRQLAPTRAPSLLDAGRTSR